MKASKKDRLLDAMTGEFLKRYPDIREEPAVHALGEVGNLNAVEAIVCRYVVDTKIPLEDIEKIFNGYFMEERRKTYKRLLEDMPYRQWDRFQSLQGPFRKVGKRHVKHWLVELKDYEGHYTYQEAKTLPVSGALMKKADATGLAVVLEGRHEAEYLKIVYRSMVFRDSSPRKTIKVSDVYQVTAEAAEDNNTTLIFHQKAYRWPAMGYHWYVDLELCKWSPIWGLKWGRD